MRMTQNMRFTDSESETGTGPGGLTDGVSDGMTVALGRRRQNE
jgi:hypothetical protein